MRNDVLNSISFPLGPKGRKKQKRALIAALGCVFLCTSSWSLDLSQAYLAAMERDATIRAARAATAAKRERLPQARAQLLPNISASASRNRNALESTAPNSLGIPATSNRDYNSSAMALTLRQPIFRKYQMADYRQAKAQVDSFDAILETELQNVAVRVSGAYFEALLTTEQLALVLAQKTAYASKLDAARKRFSAGVGTLTDIYEAQAGLDLNVAQELEARQNVDFTRRQIQTLVNSPIDKLAALGPDKIVLTLPLPNRVEDWIERAEASSPELRSLRSLVEAARYEVEKSQAGHSPTLDAVAQLSRNESDTVTSVNNRYSNRSIGLQFNLPIFAGGYVNSTVRQALADQERAEHALEAFRRDLGERVHREFRGVTEGVLKVKAFEQAVRSTALVTLSNQRSFEAGSRTLPDTLHAAQQNMLAQSDLAKTRSIYILSKIRLQALTGDPITTVIYEINGWLKN
jgi:TolC family type I secretion outer membrane protein